MSIYTIIILTILLVYYAINQIADWLNRKSSVSTLPDELQDLYDADDYRESLEYSRDKTRFNQINATVGLIFLLVFWFAGGFSVLDLWLRSWGFDLLITGTIFILCFSLGKELLQLPLLMYSVFNVEKKYRLSQATVATILLDTIKNFILRLILLPLPIYMVLWIFENTGQDAFLWVWLFISVAALVIEPIVMPLIQPLFNRFEALKEGSLRTAILAYAEQVNYKVDDVLVVDSSKRSSISAAYISSFLGRKKHIILCDSLLEQFTETEIIAVVAQVVAVDKQSKWIIGQLGMIAMIGTMFYLLSLFITEQEIFNSFGVVPSVYAGVVFFTIVFPPVEMIFGIFRNKFLSYTELQADISAAKSLNDRETLISVLKKVSVKNLSNLTPHPFYALLNHSDTPLLQRMKAIRAA